jgi:hypothetical protein
MEHYGVYWSMREVLIMQNIINSIKQSNSVEEVKQLLKPLSKQNTIKVAKGLDVEIRGNENKTEIINNIILEIVKK